MKQLCGCEAVVQVFVSLANPSSNLYERAAGDQLQSSCWMTCAAQPQLFEAPRFDSPCRPTWTSRFATLFCTHTHCFLSRAMNVVRPRSAMFKRPLQVFCVLAFFSLLLFGLPRDSNFREYLINSETAAVSEPGRAYEAALVIASQKNDNTTWLQHQFQAWRKSVYVVDDKKADLNVPQNKGRESMVYLSYVEDGYLEINRDTDTKQGTLSTIMKIWRM